MLCVKGRLANACLCGRRANANCDHDAIAGVSTVAEFNTRRFWLVCVPLDGEVGRMGFPSPGDPYLGSPLASRGDWGPLRRSDTRNFQP
jgi:hypothetical protein